MVKINIEKFKQEASKTVNKYLNNKALEILNHGWSDEIIVKKRPVHWGRLHVPFDTIYRHEKARIKKDLHERGYWLRSIECIDYKDFNTKKKEKIIDYSFLYVGKKKVIGLNK